MTAQRCNGLDPAYPRLTCYRTKGHGGPCEFTDAVGEAWRRRALAAEHKVEAIKARHTLEVVAQGTPGDPDDPPDQFYICRQCSNRYGTGLEVQGWPCPDIAALDAAGLGLSATIFPPAAVVTTTSSNRR